MKVLCIQNREGPMGKAFVEVGHDYTVIGEGVGRDWYGRQRECYILAEVEPYPDPRFISGFPKKWFVPLPPDEELVKEHVEELQETF